MRVAGIENALGVSFAERHIDGRRVLSADVPDLQGMIDRARALCVETERDAGALVVGLFDADDAHRVHLFPKTDSLELVEISPMRSWRSTSKRSPSATARSG